MEASLDQGRSQQCVERSDPAIEEHFLPFRNTSESLDGNFFEQKQHCNATCQPDEWIHQVHSFHPHQNSECEQCQHQGKRLKQHPPDTKGTLLRTHEEITVCQRQHDPDLQCQSVNDARDPAAKSC